MGLRVDYGRTLHSGHGSESEVTESAYVPSSGAFLCPRASGGVRLGAGAVDALHRQANVVLVAFGVPAVLGTAVGEDEL